MNQRELRSCRITVAAIFLHFDGAVEVPGAQPIIAGETERLSVERQTDDQREASRRRERRPGADPTRSVALRRDDERQQRGACEGDRQLHEIREEVRREHGDEEAAGRASGGDRKVECSQPLRRRLQRGELAVADHATDEEARAVDRNFER